MRITISLTGLLLAGCATGPVPTAEERVMRAAEGYRITTDYALGQVASIDGCPPGYVPTVPRINTRTDARVRREIGQPDYYVFNSAMSRSGTCVPGRH